MIEASGYVAAANNPPATTNAGSDTLYTFSEMVKHVTLQNTTPANAYYSFDGPASPGSLMLPPASALFLPKECITVHLYTAAAQNINGSTVGNIVVLGSL